MVTAKAKSSYEECRLRRVEENKKRMEVLTSKSPLGNHLRLQMKQVKSRTVKKQAVGVRRYSRVAKMPAPVYSEVDRVHMEISRRIYSSDEARVDALERAEKLELHLETVSNFCKFNASMPCQWGNLLGLPGYFCRKNLPRRDGVIKLIDNEGEEYLTIYLARCTGLGGGWKEFVVTHGLVDGDALIFQLIRSTAFKGERF